jgi:hypothetical protein
MHQNLESWRMGKLRRKWKRNEKAKQKKLRMKEKKNEEQ